MAGSFSRVRDQFAEQFTPDGDGYVYRKGGKGPPRHCSVAEAEAQCRRFNAALLQSSLLLLLMVGGLGAGLAILGSGLGESALLVGILIIVLGSMTVYMALFFRAWNRPDRQLSRGPQAR